MLSQIIGTVILDSDGGRLATKYASSSDPTKISGSFASQTKFEAQLMLKTNRLSSRSDGTNSRFIIIQQFPADA